MLGKQSHKLLVHLACKNHFYYIYGVLIRISESVYKSAFNIEPFEHVAYFRTAAVDQHNLDSYQRQQHNVAHNGLLEIIVSHGVTAVFHYNYLIIIILYIRQRVHQNLCPYII